MGSDFIRRSDAIEAICEDCYEDCTKGLNQKGCQTIEILKSLPSEEVEPVDVQIESTRQVLDDFSKDRVKVIRCKDCKYYDTPWRYKEAKLCTRSVLLTVKETDYCSFAERRKKRWVST